MTDGFRQSHPTRSRSEVPLFADRLFPTVRIQETYLSFMQEWGSTTF